MKLILEINNLDSCNFSKKRLKLIVEKTIEKVQPNFLSERNISLSVGLISEDEIRKINKKYRNKNSPTDVLSFGDFNSIKEVLNCDKENIFLGELLICVEDIKKYCQEKDISFEREFFKVFSHGVLHLLGLSHGKKMFTIQNEVADEVCRQ
ncbi:MAG: rRNA maturation RNase YbeY [Candidatus Moranbacteria bacterium]|jgi:probable rRNA maturation factor|nr:rRNA maturation RNase YbeY [Candidatus Moranbacteria bacterium]